jgi:hypothetical protein
MWLRRGVWEESLKSLTALNEVNCQYRYEYIVSYSFSQMAQSFLS